MIFSCHSVRFYIQKQKKHPSASLMVALKYKSAPMPVSVQTAEPTLLPWSKSLVGIHVLNQNPDQLQKKFEIYIYYCFYPHGLIQLLQVIEVKSPAHYLEPLLPKKLPYISRRIVRYFFLFWACFRPGAYYPPMRTIYIYFAEICHSKFC